MPKPPRKPSFSKPAPSRRPAERPDRNSKKTKVSEREPNREEPISPESVDLPAFSELGLSEPIAKAVAELGFESPTPIQARAIPILLEGHDLLGQAQTGTGKTAAFALPVLQRVDPTERQVQALIMVPTRELAVQVATGILKFAKHTGIRVVPVYGGQPIDRQIRQLKGGAEIVVGTPGRLQDHLRRGSLTLDHIKVCVLDEADEMLALGFLEDMETLLSMLPETRQLAFFSATMPPRVASLTKRFLRSPRQVSIEAKMRTVDTTNQTYYDVPRGKKLEALARVLDMETPGPTIVFCRTRQETNDLAEALRLRGHNADPIHGDMNQAERDRALKRFREGQTDLLVATDVAARGLDIDSVTHVINYDIPWDVEQYIHRVGRTGRAGRKGDAITLVEGRERRQLMVIERIIGAPIKPARIPTAADIAARRREAFRSAVVEALESGGFEAQLAAVEDLCEVYDPAEVAAAALHMLWQSRHANDTPQDVPADFEQPETGMARLFIGLGRQDGLRPGDLVGAITNEAGIEARAIGAIDILDRQAFVEVPAHQAESVMHALRSTKLRGRRPKVLPARP